MEHATAPREASEISALAVFRKRVRVGDEPPMASAGVPHAPLPRTYRRGQLIRRRYVPVLHRYTMGAQQRWSLKCEPHHVGQSRAPEKASVPRPVPGAATPQRVGRRVSRETRGCAAGVEVRVSEVTLITSGGSACLVSLACTPARRGETLSRAPQSSVMCCSLLRGEPPEGNGDSLTTTRAVPKLIMLS